MAQYEYKVVPAPRKGVKSKGVKSPEDRFSFALQELMNQHGHEGWEYQRAETLPSDERQGLTGSQTVYRDVLVFRRLRAPGQESVHTETIEALPAPAPVPATDSLLDSDTANAEPAFDTIRANPEPESPEPERYDIAETQGDAGHDSLTPDPNRSA